MKTKELIRRLQEEDPSGEAEVVVGGEDIYFVEAMPAYYDGRPTLLVHDEALRDKAWSIVGLHVPAGGVKKLRIVTVSAEDVFLSNPEAPVTYGDDGARRDEPQFEKLRAEMRNVIAEVDAERKTP